MGETLIAPTRLFTSLGSLVASRLSSSTHRSSNGASMNLNAAVLLRLNISTVNARLSGRFTS